MRAHHRIAALRVIVISLSIVFALLGAQSAAGAPGTDAAYQTTINAGIAALNADRAGNYQQAMPLFQQVASDEATVPNWTERTASAYLNLRAAAREKLGEYHEKGLGGLPRDYKAAAIWYQKAIDPSNGNEVSIAAVLRLAFLYANGLGVPQNRARARELLARSPSNQQFVIMLDHNLLPKSPEDVTPSQIRAAAAMESAERSKKAAEDEARRAALLRAQPSAPSRAQPSQGTSQTAACASTCRGKRSDCESRNSNQEWGTYWQNGFSLKSMMIAGFKAENCGMWYSACMKDCGIPQ